MYFFSITFASLNACERRALEVKKFAVTEDQSWSSQDASDLSVFQRTARMKSNQRGNPRGELKSEL